jgi:hypothetical protein
LSSITDAGGANFSIRFDKFPNFPYETNLFPHDGTAPLASMECDLTRVTTGEVDEEGNPIEDNGKPVCYLQDLVSANLKGG